MENTDFSLTERELANCIDQTLLKAEARSEDIRRLCQEAREYGFHTVCVNGRWVELVAEELAGSNVCVGGVVSLPLGADSTRIKVAQAREAILAGADEIDMVADLAAIVEGDERYLRKEAEAVLKVCRSMTPPVVLKVIIESAALTDQQKVFACRVLEQVGVDFIKTSTGMHPAGGAKPEDIRLMKQAAPGRLIKAAGGIRTVEQALEMLRAGASRIGTSSGVAIVQQFRAGQAQ